MLVVTEEYRIHGADFSSAKRQACGFDELHMRQLILAGRIERRISQKPEAADFNERGRSAD